MKARVHVFFKDSVFDPQGNTIAGSLNQIGFRQVKGVRVGKVFDIEMSDISESEAKTKIAEMCDKLLVNSVIESFNYEFLK